MSLPLRDLKRAARLEWKHKRYAQSAEFYWKCIDAVSSDSPELFRFRVIYLKCLKRAGLDKKAIDYCSDFLCDSLSESEQATIYHYLVDSLDNLHIVERYLETYEKLMAFSSTDPVIRKIAARFLSAEIRGKDSPKLYRRIANILQENSKPLLKTQEPRVKIYTNDSNRVDIILPTHNPGPWLSEAVESVLSQTYVNWHLIIVDDNSAPAFRSVAIHWSKVYPDKISFIAREKSGNAAAARMTGIEASSSEIIAFIDQDDRWHPHKLEQQVEYLDKHPEIQAVHTDISIIDEQGNVVEGESEKENKRRGKKDYNSMSREELAVSLFRDYRIRIVSSAVRRKAFVEIGGFDTSLFGPEDWDYWIRLADRFPIAHMEQVLFERRVHKANTVSVHRYQRALKMFCGLHKLEKQFPYLREHISKKRVSLAKRVIEAASGENRFV